MSKLANSLEELLSTFKKLRNPDTGCPWDREQDFKSIASCAIEEAYEVADAIEREDFESLKAELGDLLFQIVFHAEMAKEQNLFNLNEVVDELNSKLIRRHPHVFADSSTGTAEGSLEIWEDVKALTSSHISKLPSAVPVELSAKTCGCRLISFEFSSSTTSLRLKRFCSFAISA